MLVYKIKQTVQVVLILDSVTAASYKDLFASSLFNKAVAKSVS